MRVSGLRGGASLAAMALLVATMAGCGSATGSTGSAGKATSGPAREARYRPIAFANVDGVAVATGGPRLPPGWTLEPAGIQVTTEAQPDGLALSPASRHVYVTTSGQWDESLGVLNTSTLAYHGVPDASAFLGVVAASNGYLYVAAGGRNQVLAYKSGGHDGAIGPSSFSSLIPPLASTSGMGFAAPGYPGREVLGPGGWLYAAGTLSLSQAAIDHVDAAAGTCPGAGDVLGHTGAVGPAPGSCGVVDAIDVGAASTSGGFPVGPVPTRLIPVGQDAYGLALDASARGSTGGETLYVSNWADGADQARAGGNGTVSVVRLAPGGGGGKEIEAVPVGAEPMGIALSPDGRTLAVANALSDTVSLVALAPDGRATSVKNVPVGLGADAPGAAEPVDVAYLPNGDLLVDLFGLNAIELLGPDGQRVPEPIEVKVGQGSFHEVTVPFTMIPTGWMPWTMLVGPPSKRAAGSGPTLYVANFQGMGTDAGLYDPASNYVGAHATEGSLSVIDLPSGLASGNPGLSLMTAQAISADQLAPFVIPGYESPATDPCMAVPMPGGGEAYSPLVCEAARGQIDRKDLHMVDLHIVIVLRENKTVDSMLGYLHTKLPAVNATTADETYGPSTTPNLARLALEFGIDDNNYVAGDESETGHLTLTSGETTPATELFVHVNNDAGYRGNRNGDPLDEIDYPPHRLADEALQAGYSERTYGGDLNPSSPALANEVPESIWGNASSPAFTGTNTDFPDTNRVGIVLKGETVSKAWDSLVSSTPPPMFGKEIGLCGGPSRFCDYSGASPGDYAKYSLAGWSAAYERCRARGGSNSSCQSAMPALSIIELPDDHTDVFNDGNNPLMWAPQVMVANNDYATGELVQGLSESPFWKDTLVMIMEDDTQFTADHVNALRSYVVTAGGLAARLGPAGKASFQVSSFCGVDKTVEDLLGLPPMAICDATSYPLDSIVASSVPTGPVPTYRAVVPGTPPLLPYPKPGSPRFEPWCAGGKPLEIGFSGLLHYREVECLASEVGALAINHGA